MIKTNDIYFKLNSALYEKDYFSSNDNEKMNLIEDAMKLYIASKLNEIDSTQCLEHNNLTSLELLEVLYNKLEECDNRFDIMSHFVHYILGLASYIQNFAITWYIKEDVSEPKIDFNIKGLWDTLITSDNANLYQTYCHVLEVFKTKILEIDEIRMIKKL